MPTVRAGGTDIWYADSGAGAADDARLPVVLSHGFLMDHEMFAPQLAALAPEFRVITWDQRGHGGTRAGGPFSYWDSARDLLGLLDALGLERAVLGGMSQGGFVSLRAALLAPARAAGLVLIDSQAGQEDPALAPSYAKMHETWLAAGPAPVQDIVAAIILGPAELVDPAPWFAKWAAQDTDQLTFAFRCLMDRDDITARLAELSCPALILHGTADAAIPLRQAAELRAGLAGPARLVPVENGSHASNLSHPDAANRAILEFLRSLPAAR
jgi:pimeloyl-ACP methyl ester carboxylesterase